MNLPEKSLPKNFRSKETDLAKRYIENSNSFTVVGMPGVGISSFIRFLATKDWGYSAHIDIYELYSLNSVEFFKLLSIKLGISFNEKANELGLIQACKEKLRLLSLENKRVIILFNRFDQLNKIFTKEFFNNVRSLWEVNKRKIVFIFSANLPLSMQAKDAIDAGNISFYETSLFLKPYGETDLYELYKLNSPNYLLNPDTFYRAHILSGGHYQLCELIIKSNSFIEPLTNEFIQIQLKLIYDKLDLVSQKTLQKFILGKKVIITPTLTNLGVIKREDDKPSFFSPVFEEYLKHVYTKRMSLREIQLFNLFQERIGKVVTKEEIFDYLWKDNLDHATDWALNALIYRIRKNPEFISKGMDLKSIKKVGYLLSN